MTCLFHLVSLDLAVFCTLLVDAPEHSLVGKDFGDDGGYNGNSAADRHGDGNGEPVIAKTGS